MGPQFEGPCFFVDTQGPSNLRTLRTLSRRAAVHLPPLLNPLNLGRPAALTIYTNLMLFSLEMG